MSLRLNMVRLILHTWLLDILDMD